MVVAVCARVIYCVQKEKSVCNEDIRAYLGVALVLKVCRYLGSHSVLVALYLGSSLGRYLLCGLYGPRDYSYVGVLLDMIVDDLSQVYIADAVTIRENDIFLSALGDEIGNSHQRLKSRGIKLCGTRVTVCRDEGREYSYTARAACEIPVLTRTDMIHKRLIVVMCDYAYLGDTRIYHIGKREIHEAITAAVRHRCHSTNTRELGNSGIMNVRKYQACY